MTVTLKHFHPPRVGELIARKKAVVGIHWGEREVVLEYRAKLADDGRVVVDEDVIETDVWDATAAPLTDPESCVRARVTCGMYLPQYTRAELSAMASPWGRRASRRGHAYCERLDTTQELRDAYLTVPDGDILYAVVVDSEEISTLTGKAVPPKEYIFAGDSIFAHEHDYVAGVRLT
jgi:hypothetical protein